MSSDIQFKVGICANFSSFNNWQMPSEHFERAKKAIKLINELLLLEGQIMGWE